MGKISLIQALHNAAKTVPLCKHAAEHIIELERSEKHTKAVLRVAEKDYQYQIKELKAQIKSVKACQQYDTEYNCEVEKVDDGWLLMLSDVLEALEQENDDA